jgi:hypothetical protein
MSSLNKKALIRGESPTPEPTEPWPERPPTDPVPPVPKPPEPPPSPVPPEPLPVPPGTPPLVPPIIISRSASPTWRAPSIGGSRS